MFPPLAACRGLFYFQGALLTCVAILQRSFMTFNSYNTLMAQLFLIPYAESFEQKKGCAQHLAENILFL